MDKSPVPKDATIEHDTTVTATNSSPNPPQQNGKSSLANHDKSNVQQTGNEEKIVLPVEMISMVSLRELIGKMIRKATADLYTLTDTLPSRGDVEKKREILNYLTFVRNQMLKLLVLVKWSKNAEEIQMCQNVMAFLANQNQFFHDATHYLSIIHSDLPRARLRELDIDTAVDVLTTGEYLRMPSKIKDMMPPKPLTDGEVLDTFRIMNDLIRLRLMTTDALPDPFQKYQIADSGRIRFSIKDEFDVSLTLMGPPDNQQWWIVSLDIHTKSTTGRGACDLNISLNEQQLANLRIAAQRQLAPPPPSPPTQPQEEPSRPPLFFPLVNLHDYLHLFCLSTQLEIMYMQAVLIARTRWIGQLGVQIDQTRTKLVLTYWKGGSPTAHWAHPQSEVLQHPAENSTTIEVSVTDEKLMQRGRYTDEINVKINVRDEFQRLVERCGLGASVMLSKVDATDRPKVVSALQYPKNGLKLLWGGASDLHSDRDLMNPTEINVEQLLWHVTLYHSRCIMDKFRYLLKYQETYLNSNGLYLASRPQESSEEQTSEEEDDRHDDDIPSIVIRYRNHRYINISMDLRTGRLKVQEAGYRLGEGDAKVKELEERLNTDPVNISRHLLWLRSEVVIREIIAFAKQLSMQPFPASQMSLRPDDFTKLFGDLPPAVIPVDPNASDAKPLAAKPATTSITTAQPRRAAPLYPSHCIFLQFAQFEDWYLIITIVRNEVHSWLCCIKKTYDQSGLFQLVVDTLHVDYESMWKEHFLPEMDEEQVENSKRRSSNSEPEEESSEGGVHKRRRTDAGIVEYYSPDESIDNLSVDLRFMAKLDSLCRACITNRKIELQLRRLRGPVIFTPRPLLDSLPIPESQVLNHPAAQKMEVLYVPQRDLLRACVIKNVDDNNTTAHNKDMPPHAQPWLDRISSQMHNNVVMRASGWWACGRSECFVVIQDKFEWKNMPLPTHDINDHISLDKSSNVLSFTYTDIDNCIEHFLLDWERIYMMSYLARQSSSAWLDRYKDQLKFDSFDTNELKFIYAQNYSCSIRWDSPSKGRARQYVMSLGVLDDGEYSKHKDRPTVPHVSMQNPHWRVVSFLQDILNEKRDLIYLIQIMFQTFPLMASLEKLEVETTQRGDIGEISIIPHTVDSVRIVFPSSHALDVQFTDPHTLCVLDAAFRYTMYSSLTYQENAAGVAPLPYVAPPPPPQASGASNADENVKPVKLAQSFNFQPFKRFDALIASLENWIFDPPKDTPAEMDAATAIANSDEEPTAVPFKHGLLCSASLCHSVITQLGSLV
ncbi:mediator complex subunit MED14-domain-containing protein [Dichotomocladium elegans]|nr:mediator complex subunit MED14-domain-containing protein [Dichotomocladium elegans]